MYLKSSSRFDRLRPCSASTYEVASLTPRLALCFSGHDWNRLIHNLNNFALEHKKSLCVPVMLNAVLMSPERHQVVNPLYMVQNPYNAVNRAQDDEMRVSGLSFNYGSKVRVGESRRTISISNSSLHSLQSQSSSLDSSPVFKMKEPRESSELQGSISNSASNDSLMEIYGKEDVTKVSVCE